jgi:hypothetical protein
MTTNEFRKMALEIPTAAERSHMNHPDLDARRRAIIVTLQKRK